MKVYRYMSEKEFTKMSSGCIMINHNTFSQRRTDSVGFCFLSEEVICIQENGEQFTLSPEESLSFLSGIVSKDFLVEFDAPEECLQRSKGIYADPIGDYYDSIIAEELCTEEYDCNKFIPLRYATICYNKATWYMYNR